MNFQLPDCVHRGAVSDTGAECASNRLVHTGVVRLSDCATCRYANAPLLDLALLSAPDFHCPHRLAIIREQDCDLCGVRSLPAFVFGCDLHGECTMHKVMEKIRGCAACKDRPE